MLVNHDAEAEVTESRFGCTPLHWAASVGDINLCRVLCSAGAKATTIDKSGFSPIQYASQSQKQECVNFLRSTSPSFASTCTQENKGGVQDNSSGVSGWEKLVDESTGYIYYHNWKTGQSMWEDDYIIWRRSIARGGLKPIGSSFSNRPPPPLSGMKSFSIPNQVNHLQTEDDVIDIDARAQEKESTPINHIDETDIMKSHIADDVEEDKSSNVDAKARHFQNKESEDIDAVIEVSDFKSVLSDSDDSSSSTSMIQYGDVGMDNAEGGKVMMQEKDTAENNINKDAQEAQPKELGEALEIQIPTNPIMLSPISSPIPSSKKMVTHDSFNQRLTTLQSRMEEQLNRQLQKIEDKITQKPEGIDDEGKVQNVVDKLSDADKTISELSSKVVQLQTDVGTKDLEIVSLKRQVTEFEQNIVSSTNKVSQCKDISIGDNDVRDNIWVHSKEVLEKDKHLSEQQEKIEALQSTLQRKNEEISNLEENQIRGKEQVLQLEELLKQEKDAKNEAIILLEQRQRGMEVDAEVTKSLQDEKRRGEEELLRLSNELKAVEIKRTEERNQLKKQLGESQQQLVIEQSKIKSLEEKNKRQEQDFEEEKERLVHKNIVDIQELRDSLQTDFEKKTRIIENKLQEEQLARMENEVERNEAREKYENAIKATKRAELELERMSTMVNEAKALIGANENLHRSLHIEIDKRKYLHNCLEDIRGKIRVYVRVRPLSSSEHARKCQEALVKEDKRTCVLHRSGNVKSWEFDHIFHGSFDTGNSQEDVFKDTRRLVTSAIDGFNVCIFAYGQTGSGKTYTMFGPGGEIPSIDDITSLNADLGLAPRVACELFRLIEDRKTSFNVKVQMNMFEVSLFDIFVLK